MLLEGKNAVIYGAGGSIGGAVARAFAREGARVHLAGRTLASLEKVAQEIRSARGMAETAQVDALDERAVDEHADAVAAAGGIDVSKLNTLRPHMVAFVLSLRNGADRARAMTGATANVSCGALVD